MRNWARLLLMATVLGGTGCGILNPTSTPPSPSSSLKSGAWELNIEPANGGIGTIVKMNLTVPVTQASG
jgi:hypothetical protein